MSMFKGATHLYASVLVIAAVLGTGKLKEESSINQMNSFSINTAFLQSCLETNKIQPH